jgi:hypothetical protein
MHLICCSFQRHLSSRSPPLSVHGVCLSIKLLQTLPNAAWIAECTSRGYLEPFVQLSSRAPGASLMASSAPLPRFKLSDLKEFKNDAFVAIDGYVYNMTPCAPSLVLRTSLR